MHALRTSHQVRTQTGVWVPTWKFEQEERRTRLFQLVYYLANLGAGLPLENDRGRKACQDLISAALHQKFPGGDPAGEAGDVIREVGEELEWARSSGFLDDAQCAPVYAWIQSLVPADGAR